MDGMGRRRQDAPQCRCRSSRLAAPEPRRKPKLLLRAFLAAALARLGELGEARAAVQAGLVLDPSFTIRRFRDATNTRSDNPTFLAGRDRGAIEGMRLAGVPQG
jgi:hypothetical protein